MKNQIATKNVIVALAILAATTLALTGQARAEEEQLDTTFKVYWKDGLRMDTADKSVRLKLGGRILHDSTWWDKSDEVQTVTGSTRNGSEFRAARLYLAGEVYKHVVFKGQYDFANDDGANFKDVYMGFRMKDKLGEGSSTSVLFGHLKEPFSLEEMTSSRFITFMERGLPNIFAVGRQTGVTVFNNFLDNRLSVGFAVSQPTDDDQGGTSGNKYTVTSRIAGTPMNNGSDRKIHLGFSHSYGKFDKNEARYRQRPEVHDSPRFVDTDDFSADDAHNMMGEFAAVFGPFSVQSEVGGSIVDSDATDDPEFFGAYVLASWFITGEHRNYDDKKAAFNRVKPHNNLFQGGWGAWEIAARYSHLDLDDSDADGGELDNVTVGINWYWNPNTRVMFNFVNADLDRASADTDTQAFMVRTQIDF
jgi:phosphate-selective porin OprO/OprP